MKYKLVIEVEYKLEAAVQAWCDKGWRPLGPPVVTRPDESGGALLAQALTKAEHEG